jgi:putative ABC transport system permease protein
MRTSRMLADAGQDLKTAFRNLLRAPMTAATIVLTVGLGIAGTTVIFGAVNATILRPLPYADAGQLVRIYTDAPPNRFRFSVADYLALQEQQTRFAQIAGFTDRETSYASASGRSSAGTSRPAKGVPAASRWSS